MPPASGGAVRTEVVVVSKESTGSSRAEAGIVEDSMAVETASATAPPSTIFSAARRHGMVVVDGRLRLALGPTKKKAPMRSGAATNREIVVVVVRAMEIFIVILLLYYRYCC